MKIYKLNTLTIYILISLGFLLSSKTIYAQDIGIGIYPPIMQVDATPPSEPKADIFIENLTDKSVDLNISYKPFNAAASKDGQIEIEDNFQSFPDPLFANRIIILDQDTPVKTISLAPKQGKKLQMDLKIPANQQKGDYYFTVLFTTTPNSSTLSNSSQAVGSVAMNVLASVGPKGPTDGYIKELTTPFFVDKGPIPFKINVANTSDHFITPTGTITIKNMFGQKIGKFDILAVNILSNSERFIPDSAQNDPKSKSYNELIKISEESKSPVAIWPEKFLLGPYTATLELNLSDKGPVLIRSVSFFAFPITLIIGLIIIIVITIFIILRVKNRLSRYN